MISKMIGKKISELIGANQTLVIANSFGLGTIEECFYMDYEYLVGTISMISVGRGPWG